MQNFLQVMIGKPINKIWMGYAGVLFLEIGNLHKVKRTATKKNGETQEYFVEVGDFSFMIQPDWNMRFDDNEFTQKTLQENFVTENLTENITDVALSQSSYVFSLHFGVNNSIEKKIKINKNKEMSIHDYFGKIWYVFQGDTVLIEKSDEE